MQLVKVVNYKRKYISKIDGKEHPSVTYYIKADLATSEAPAKVVTLAIMPKFDKNRSDWFKLDTLAKVEVVRDEDE